MPLDDTCQKTIPAGELAHTLCQQRFVQRRRCRFQRNSLIDHDITVGMGGRNPSDGMEVGLSNGMRTAIVRLAG